MGYAPVSEGRQGCERVEVELALDDVCRQVGEFGVGVADADALERSGHVDVRVFGHHALGLFDDDAARSPSGIADTESYPAPTAYGVNRGQRSSAERRSGSTTG